MEARPLIDDNAPGHQLDQLVARIQSRPSHRVLTAPSPDSIQSVIAHLQAEKPLSAAEIAEHERLWHEVETEMRAREQANDRSEELL